MVPLSILDLSPVAAGSSGAVALRNSLDLARLADTLGFTRYWVAEHHNLPSIASSAPDIMIGQIAAATARIRVGSGGVMLPNHAPLMVAERFKVLEALFPGRIDLGLGRAPGTDPVTSYALRRRQDAGGDDDFLERFQELVLFESNAFPQGHPFRSVRAMPQDVALPPIWLLGSSGYSAQLAAMVGAGFAFAHHFADHDAAAAMLSYRNQFRPSPAHAALASEASGQRGDPTLRAHSASEDARERADDTRPEPGSSARASPYAIFACAVVCADSDAEAERLASTIDLNFVRRSRGEYLPLASPEEAAAYPYSPAERSLIARNRARLFVGAQATVRAALAAMIAATKADEVMVTTMLYDHAARRHSYELLADAFGLRR
jgi:alkanesulfonate monooxygenase SsuD/methylene tetrahydromethanopterin reductase-like flavin-dependent oxidoreductase (luciferase family)